MAMPFSRSTRALHADDPRRSLLWVAVFGAAAVAWIAWLALARVAVYAEAVSARIEADAAAHVLQSDADGRVTEVAVGVGDRVSKGQVVLALDSSAERLRLEGAQAQLASLEPQLVALRAQLETAGITAVTSREAERAAVDEAKARLEEAAAAARRAEDESVRLRALADDGNVAQVEAEQAEAQAVVLAAAAEAARRRVELLSWDRRTAGGDRDARRVEVEREVAVIEGQIAMAGAEVAAAEQEVARREVRAPVAGVIGELASLRPGSVVRRGEAVGAVVPDGDLKVVALFTPADATGRVKPGQPGQVRLDGFSWTQYGTLAARVRSVAAEPRDGLVRVELDLQADPQTRIPLQHGLPGTVEVEVERASPATLLLRVAGSRITGDRQ